MSKLFSRLENEPVVKSVGLLGLAQAVVAILGVLGVLSGDQVSAIVLILTGLGAPAAVTVARAQTTGPVTASQMIRLPGTDPTEGR